MHSLGTSSAEVTFNYRVARHGAHGIFGGNDHLISMACLLHPFADPLLGLTTMIDTARTQLVYLEWLWS